MRNVKFFVLNICFFRNVPNRIFCELAKPWLAKYKRAKFPRPHMNNVLSSRKINVRKEGGKWRTLKHLRTNKTKP